MLTVLYDASAKSVNARMVVAEAFHKRVLTYNYIWSNSLDGNRPPKMFEIIIDAAFWWSVVKKK